MDRVVAKYPLKTEDEQTVFLPRDAEIIAAEWQTDPYPGFVLWALVDEDVLNDERGWARLIAIRRTGIFISASAHGLVHISTIQMPEYPGRSETLALGSTWHIFERV